MWQCGNFCVIHCLSLRNEYNKIAPQNIFHQIRKHVVKEVFVICFQITILLVSLHKLMKAHSLFYKSLHVFDTRFFLYPWQHHFCVQSDSTLWLMSGYHAETPITIKAEPSIWPTAAFINIHEHPL